MNQDTKRIVKNTGLLYFRMFLSMAIGLYSVRIVLESLGDIDFGIYNVVAGIVTMLAFLNNALSSTTQRFLSYENGKLNEAKLNDIFNNSMSLYILLCLFVFIIAESAGLWMVNKYLVIPSNRVFAANVIYQFSIISFVFSILTAPYNAVIIAREKMGVFAYISIAESLVKLVLVLILLYVGSDKLIIYGVMMMFVNFVVLLTYIIYCSRNFSECEFRWNIDKQISREIGKFANWSIWGAFSNIFKNQGVNILLNKFFGVVINTARGIAYQIDGALNTCVQNFLLAVKPQIIKNYAIGDYTRMFHLAFLSTRLGFYLMLLIILIFLCNTQFILTLWLGQYPTVTVNFTKLVLIASLINVLPQPIMMIIHATGNIKVYQLGSCVINISVLPISYILLKIFNSTYIPFIVIIFAMIGYYIFTLKCCMRLVAIPVKIYGITILKLFVVSSLMIFLAYIFNGIYRCTSLLHLGCFTLVILVLLAGFIYMIDLNQSERKTLRNIIISKFAN